MGAGGERRKRKVPNVVIPTMHGASFHGLHISEHLLPFEECVSFREIARWLIVWLVDWLVSSLIG
jgi:hypothetical protein